MDKLLLRRLYKHFTGKVVIIIGFAKTADTKEDVVIFSSVDGTEEDVKVLTIDKWHKSAMKDGREVKRYTLV